MTQDAPHKVLPTARDTAAGGASGLPDVSPEEGTRRTVTHELGNGLEEAAAGPNGQSVDAQIVREYGDAVGWRGDHLYDIGAPAVQQALDRHEEPPAAFEITAQNWQRGWQEQPISAYQVGHGPFEDLPEAIMAYRRTPQLLRDRSPRRFAFVENRRQMLQQAHALRTPDAAAAAGSR